MCVRACGFWDTFWDGVADDLATGTSTYGPCVHRSKGDSARQATRVVPSSPMSDESDGGLPNLVWPPSKPKSNVPVLVMTAAAVVVVGLGAFVAVRELRPDAVKTVPLAVTVKLYDYEGLAVSGNSCAGDGGYSDMKVGAQITVRDAAGKIVAVGALDRSQKGKNDSHCDLMGTVAAVPDEELLQVEVSHRGNVTYTRADRASGVVLTLGG